MSFPRTKAHTQKKGQEERIGDVNCLHDKLRVVLNF